MWFVCDLYFWNRYGNGASIFTTSGVAARKFQTEIEAGQVKSDFINSMNHFFWHPFHHICVIIYDGKI